MTNGEKLKTLFPTIRLSYDILGQRRIFDRNMLIADDEWWNAEYKEIEEKQEPKTGWNNHQIACMLADLFGDTCACNYNGIDEWLSELCDFKDTCCPHPVGVACWEQFLKYSQSRYTECGYEVRDKGALQEPKEGHWILTDDDYVYCSECEDSYYPRPIDASWYYCPHCGAKMESEEQE